MKINKKALIGMCGGILLADILFVGWALNSLRANETNTVYETKSPAVPVVSAKEKKPETEPENGFLDSKRLGSKETDGGIDV